MVAAGTHSRLPRRSITVWAAFLSAGGFVSPVLGGLAAKIKFGSHPSASWGWGFIAVLVLAVTSATVSAFFARNSAAPEGRSLDWPGQITIAVALSGVGPGSRRPVGGDAHAGRYQFCVGNAHNHWSNTASFGPSLTRRLRAGRETCIPTMGRSAVRPKPGCLPRVSWACRAGRIRRVFRRDGERTGWRG